MLNNIVNALNEQGATVKRLAELTAGCAQIYEAAERECAELVAKFESDTGETVAVTVAQSATTTSAPKKSGKRGRPAKATSTTATTATVATTGKKRGRKATPGQVLEGVDLSEAKNKSDAVKIVLAIHANASPKDILATCSAAGLDLTTGLISAIKSSLKSGNASVGTGRRGRPKKKTGSLPLPAIVQQVLASNGTGLKLDELVAQVVDNGYEYSGPARKNSEQWRKAVAQNVYQCCNDLMKAKTRRGWEGETPLVLRDDTSKRYMLNTDAKKAA